MDRARSFHERLFLEAWYSRRDSNAGNEHIDIPDANSSFPFPATPALSYSFGQSCYVKAYNPLKNSAWLVFAKMKLIFARNLNLAKIYKVEFIENTQQ